MERKRQRPAASADSLQQEGPLVDGRSTKHPKLILKPPKFLTAKQRKHESRQELSSLLENMLDLESAAEVVEHLLRLMDTCRIEGKEDGKEMRSTEEIAKCLSALTKLAKTHREDISVYCVLVHALEMLVVHWRVQLRACLPKNLQSFVLSLMDHGEPGGWVGYFYYRKGRRGLI